MDQQQQEARFARVVGMGFLSFVCAARQPELDARLQHGRALRPEQEAVLGQVLDAATQSAIFGFQVGAGEADFLDPLLEYDKSARTSRPNVLRRAAGGSIPRVRGCGPAERALATLARDFYPTLLLNPPTIAMRMGLPRWRQRTWSMFPVSFRHPASAEFEAAVEADSLLNALFPWMTPESGKSGFIWTSLGTGRGIQLSMLSHDLLIATLFKPTLDGDFDQAAFMDGSIKQLRLLRRLVAGEQVSVRCSVAFVGAELRGQPLKTPWGTVRAPSNGELDFRADTPVAHSQELVLETEIPLKLWFDTDPPAPDGGIRPSPFSDEVGKIYSDIQRKADLLALTLLLGVDRDPVVAIARTWTLIENPLNQGPTLSWVQNAVPLHPHVLMPVDRRRVRTWAARIERGYNDRIEIAVKRTLSSLTTRGDATDRLIDAVIALENLFGTRSGKLTFHISTGCAYLLERDATRRVKVKKEVSRLYAVRSKIVHGERARSAHEVEPDAAAAAAFAVRSLRALFENRPALIDKPDRSRLLILGG